jgi:hypothetical protein
VRGVARPPPPSYARLPYAPPPPHTHPAPLPLPPRREIARARCAQGLYYVHCERFDSAVAAFRALPAALGGAFPPLHAEDAGALALLCALTCLARPALRALCDCEVAKLALEGSAALRGAVEAVLRCGYAEALAAFDALAPPLRADPWVGDPAGGGALRRRVRARLVTLYFAPFSHVQLERAAEALGGAGGAGALAREVAALVEAGALQGRLDAVAGVFEAERRDPREAAAARVVATAEGYTDTASRLLLQIALERGSGGGGGGGWGGGSGGGGGGGARRRGAGAARSTGANAPPTPPSSGNPAAPAAAPAPAPAPAVAATAAPTAAPENAAPPQGGPPGTPGADFSGEEAMDFGGVDYDEDEDEALIASTILLSSDALAEVAPEGGAAGDPSAGGAGAGSRAMQDEGAAPAPAVPLAVDLFGAGAGAEGAGGAVGGGGWRGGDFHNLHALSLNLRPRWDHAAPELQGILGVDVLAGSPLMAQLGLA